MTKASKLSAFVTAEDNEALQDALKRNDLETYYAINNAISERYLASFGGDPQKIMAAIEEEIEPIQKEDFLECLEQRKKDTENIEDYPAQYLEESHESACDFLYGVFFGLFVELMNNSHDSEYIEAVARMVDRKASQWYKKEGKYLPMLRTKPTTTIGLLSPADITFKDPKTNSIIYTKDDVKIAIQNIERATNQININLDKLLSAALAAFYHMNHAENSGAKTVSFDFDSYAQALGYDIYNPDKKIAKSKRDNARKSINKDLVRLGGIVISWKEKPKKGAPTDYTNMSLVQKSCIIGDNITITFSDDFAAFLRQARLATQYPTALLGVSAKDPNTYKIGKKIIDHYNQYNNIKNETNNIIGVKSLLNVTELQSYEELKAKNNRNWARLIKEPFENALENLVQRGVLATWQYCREKKILLSDIEAADILNSYDNFEGLYILFEPAGRMDHIEAMKRKGLKDDREAKKHTRR